MTSRVVSLNGRLVGDGFPPYIVAELSGNHNQSLDRAMLLVDAAASAGVNAIKLQTYTADTMTMDMPVEEFIVQNSDSPWNEKSLYQLYKEAYTPWEWHDPIMKRCKDNGLHFFSSPFDESAVDFLETLDVPFYKIASPEIIDIPLVQRVAKTGKPTIVSTGMANLSEIYQLAESFRKAGGKDLILLKCTTAYPAPPEEINLATISNMRDLFDVPIGLSDHSLGVGVAIASVALGACLIEKHFTLKRSDGGVDSQFSLEPSELTLLCEEAKRAWLAIGKVNYSPTKEEIKNRQFRRSIYVSKDILAGEMFTIENIQIIRPAYGLAPKHFHGIAGRKASQFLKRGTPLSWEHVE
ncbi:pseudaminic acid synthase [Polynucleobacter bastaniensis]|uniref:pseudaminic acid synthase n=1 Tax=Polynucleobacter bastaniensis TaxID=2081039 RepID=UPI001C0B2845|nr:pseudaminic acid synthase [Polynucleobacter bastaniensis]MBU3597324.1 pseudaminic acid synthase [Polynucleobacter bastaniensis]